MKIITNTKTVVEGSKITITAELADKDFGLPVQQTTIGHGVATNPHHPRHVQISNEAIFVKRMGNREKKGAAIGWLIDELVDVFVAIDPALTDAPQFVDQPSAAQPDGSVNSEIDFTTKWEQSDDGKKWKEVDKSSANAAVFHRCIVTNAAGSTTSKTVKLK